MEGLPSFVQIAEEDLKVSALLAICFQRRESDNGNEIRIWWLEKASKHEVTKAP